MLNSQNAVGIPELIIDNTDIPKNSFSKVITPILPQEKVQEQVQE